MVAQIDMEILKKRPIKLFGRVISWTLIEGRPLTTKGQWINGLVFLGYRVAQALPLRKGAEQPIYIVGTGRSGTTVLGRLFAMHEQIVFLNEPKAVWHYAHGAEDIIGSYTNGASAIRLNPSDASSEQASKIAKIYSNALRAGFARRVVDKYPELVFRVPFVKALFPQAKFIAILRDGVDTCSSVTEWSTCKGETVGAETHDWWGRDDRKWHMIVDELVSAYEDLAPMQAQLKAATDHRDRAAVEWIVSMREARKMATDHPEVFAITYEDLCADPDRVLPEIMMHCGLDDDPVCTDYAKAILSAAEQYKPLELMPELVAPFTKVLVEMGYEDSCERVRTRTGDIA